MEYQYHWSVRLLVLVLCFWLQGQVLAGCSKRKKMKIWSTSKCVAGRIFFARLDHIPSVLRSFSNRKIIQPYAFPWIAQIKDVRNGQSLCTGVLINDRYVLSTQRNILPPIIQVKDLVIVLGYDNGYHTEEPDILQPHMLERKVTKLVLHPNYNQFNGGVSNDLALLKFTPIKYSKTIYPIQLPTYMDRFKDFRGSTVENAGWSINAKFNKHFKQLPMVVTGKEICAANYKNLFVKSILCTLPPSDLCHLKHEGPLMLEKTGVYNVTILIGMISLSPEQCNKPIVSIRIDQKLPWIKKNTNDAIYCQY